MPQKISPFELSAAANARSLTNTPEPGRILVLGTKNVHEKHREHSREKNFFSKN
jgi:hypothetical protein